MSSKYDKQRSKVIPPHVSLRVLRDVANMNLSQVCFRVNQHLGTPDRVKPGTISAIELGHRGASEELIAALEYAYGLEPGMISTDYLPRVARDLAKVSGL